MLAPLPAAMVLCAGYGTRLRPLTEELPKPLVPVGDRSVLGHIASALKLAGFKRLVVNAHHLPEVLRGALEGLPLAATLVEERDDIRGTAGGVAGAAKALGEGEVLVANGDILAELDVAALLAAHRGSSLATLAVRGGLPAGAGTVGIGADGCVVRLRDGRYGEELQGAEFVGTQLLSEAARERLPAAGCLVGDVYMPALEEGLVVRAADVVRAFHDIGTLSAYLEANLAWLGGRDGWKHPSASCVASLKQALVGADAVVSGEGSLERVVVLPGAHVQAPLSDAVVTPSGRIIALKEPFR
jgi:mannose-1-phosphate guanylyltransferase